MDLNDLNLITDIIFMKISIFSDLHFGHNASSKLENDSFDHADEAIRKSMDSDLILIPGDIYDSKFPKTDVWARSLKVLSKAILANKHDIKLVDTINKNLEEISQKTLQGIPIIALHGTHERLTKGQQNAIQALEQAGFVIHLHLNGLVFEKNGVKVAIQGMSGVPERYAKQILDKWDPKPINGCYNILLLHQSIEPFIYSPLEPPTISTSNLPKGFDLIVNGHIHTPQMEKINGTTLLLAGSTVITQLKKEEAETPKGLFELQLPENKIYFIELENSRNFFYEEIVVEENKSIQEQLKERVDKILSQNLTKEPIIRFKLISKKPILIDRELKKLENDYEGKAILRFSKQVDSEDVAAKIEFLKKMRGGERVSVEEMGITLLQKNLEILKFSKKIDSDYLFRLLADGQVDKAFDILTGQQKTIGAVVKSD